MSMTDHNEENYQIPRLNQHYFGAGLKRPRVQFVPASTNDEVSVTTKSNREAIAKAYLKTVLYSSRQSSERSISDRDVAISTMNGNSENE